MRSRAKNSRPQLKVLACVIVVLLVGVVGGKGTWALFSADTENTGNRISSGSVALEDNDGGSALLSIPSGGQGASDTSCIKVTSKGSLPADVRLYGSTTGSGLDPYVSLMITRGTYSPSEPAAGSCTNFVPDSSTYLSGQSQGVVYAGTLQDFPDSFNAGLIDARAADPETWSNNESHVYKIQMTIGDDNAAAGKDATQGFTWEARNQSLYTSNVLGTAGLQGYWRLGESSGTTAFDKHSTNEGTYTSGPTLGTAGAIAGDTDTAATFDGTDDYVRVPDSPNLDLSSAMSVEMWVRPSSVGGAYFPLVIKDAAYNLRINNSAEGSGFAFSPYSGGTFEPRVQAGPAIANQWQHVVATYDGSNSRMYIDGKLRATEADSGAIPVTANDMLIGGAVWSGTAFAAAMDEVAVYNTALSASQVEAHHAAGRGN
jgi:Concanavalin A-like lectin/glucanases superfamily